MKRVEAIFDEDARAHPVGGMTVGIVSGPKLIWTKSYGLADIAAGKAADKDTVYRVGSITKQFTALMYLQLLERGVVSETDAAQTYFPALKQIKGTPEQIAHITLGELATHRSGLDREPDDPRFVSGAIDDWEKTLTAAMPHLAIAFPQGGDAHYSNIGYAILGASIEVAAKQPYLSYVPEHILVPLGMTHSGFKLTADMKAHLARGYAVKDGVGDSTLADKELRDGRGYKIPPGGLFTTVGDLAKFVSFEMGYGPPSVLSVKALHAAQSKFYPMPPNPQSQYGIALFSTVANGHRQFGHSGSVAGFAAYADFDPDAKVGVICLRNTDSRNGCDAKVINAALAALAGDGATP